MPEYVCNMLYCPVLRAAEAVYTFVNGKRTTPNTHKAQIPKTQFMKRIKSLFIIHAALVLAAALAGCTGGDRKTSSLELLQQELEIPARGGEITLTYLLRDPDGSTRIQAAADNDWLTGFRTDIPGCITFQAAANETESPRSATVEVTYGSVRQQARITQTAGERPREGFEITVFSTTQTEAAYRVVPPDDEIRYLSMVIEKSIMDTYPSEEQFFEEEMMIFTMMAGSMELSLEEYLEQISLTGTQERWRDELRPGVAYYAYAYGIEMDGTPLTGIYKQEFSTEKDPNAGMTFGIDCRLSGYEADITFAPSDENQLYVYDVWSDERIYWDLDNIYQNHINRYIRQSGLSAEEAVREIAVTGTVRKHYELDADTDYTAFAFAISPDGTLISEASLTKFRTGPVSPSDNRLTISIDEVHAHTAVFSIRTTCSDTYVFFLDRTAAWQGHSDEEIQRLLIRDYDARERLVSGDRQEKAAALMSSTAYTVYAFGMEAGRATTPLFTANFTTSAGESSSVTFSLEYDRFFDGEAAMEARPDIYSGLTGYAVLPTRAVTGGGDVSGYYYSVFIFRDMSDPDKYPDDMMINSLLGGNGFTTPERTFFVPYAQPSTAVGFAVDAEGNPGPVFRKIIRVNREDASPIEELIPGKSE